MLGVPCNQFAGQEPGSSEEIAEFCSATYGVSFPLTEKVDVNGADRHPLYAELVDVADAEGYTGDIRWNFEKFLVSPAGEVVARFDPRTEPEDASRDRRHRGPALALDRQARWPHRLGLASLGVRIRPGLGTLQNMNPLSVKRTARSRSAVLLGCPACPWRLRWRLSYRRRDRPTWRPVPTTRSRPRRR